ncbi:mycothiol synthase [soil metagenome]
MSQPDPAAAAQLRVRAGLTPAETAAVSDLLGRAEQADGAGPLNEQAWLNLRSDSERVRHVLGYDDDDLIAYGQLDMGQPAAQGQPAAEVTAECVVDPGQRRRGLGTALVARLLAEAANAPLLLWSHGGHPAAPELASRLGFERVREQWQLRRRLGPDAEALPEVRLPVGIVVRTFVVGQDEPAWRCVNARAFAQHPEQGGITADDLAQRIDSSWFDPAGFFLAERSEDGDDRLVGFHWTKVKAADDGPVGEVYVVGVDPDEQGSGLGSALTAIGLRHLADRGVNAVLLYVEADNAAALRVYERLGFAHVGTDTQYRHPGASSDTHPRPR